jgi:imidazoleglycerol-phosphate dehydratase
MRLTELSRKTNETEITVKINLDGNGNSEIDTSIPFFTHMLETFSRHSGIDLTLYAKGDMQHHIIEDTAYLLGQTINKLIDNTDELNRYGYTKIPMDDSIAEATLDLARKYIKFNYTPKYNCAEGMQTIMIEHFFVTLADQAGITIHINASGTNDHHTIEAIFKAFAHAFNESIQINRKTPLSTKGFV